MTTGPSRCWPAMDACFESTRAESNARRCALLISATAFFLVVLGLVSLPVAAQETSDDWQFAATINGWFPDIGGHTALPIGDGTVDVDVSRILDHLEMTVQGSFEFHKARWGGFTDVVYMDVGESQSGSRNTAIGNVPVAVTAHAEFDLKSLFWTVAGVYRVRADQNARFDLLVGARLADLKQRLDWDFVGDFGPGPAPPRTGTRSASADQWDAVLGAKGQIALGAHKRWVVPWYVDIGAGDSDLTWRAALGLGHAFRWGQISVTWTELAYELSHGPIDDLDFSGPSVGATFRW